MMGTLETRLVKLLPFRVYNGTRYWFLTRGTYRRVQLIKALSTVEFAVLAAKLVEDRRALAAFEALFVPRHPSDLDPTGGHSPATTAAHQSVRGRDRVGQKTNHF
jgi:hypothetical protein